MGEAFAASNKKAPLAVASLKWNSVVSRSQQIIKEIRNRKQQMVYGITIIECNVANSEIT